MQPLPSVIPSATTKAPQGTRTCASGRHLNFAARAGAGLGQPRSTGAQLTQLAVKLLWTGRKLAYHSAKGGCHIVYLLILLFSHLFSQKFIYLPPLYNQNNSCNSYWH